MASKPIDLLRSGQCLRWRANKTAIARKHVFGPLYSGLYSDFFCEKLTTTLNRYHFEFSLEDIHFCLRNVNLIWKFLWKSLAWLWSRSARIKNATSTLKKNFSWSFLKVQVKLEKRKKSKNMNWKLNKCVTYCVSKRWASAKHWILPLELPCRR